MIQKKDLYLVAFLSISRILQTAQAPAASATAEPTFNQERIKNMIIFNDTKHETYWFKKEDNPILFEEKNAPAAQNVVTLLLQKALAQKQVALCTKSLWRNLNFKARVWSDLLAMDIGKIFEKYSYMSNISRDYFYLLKSAALTLEAHMAKKDVLPKDDFDKILTDIFNTSGVNNNVLLGLFLEHTGYQYILQQDAHDCFDLGVYILFIPKIEFYNFERTRDRKSEIPTQKLFDIYMGLNLSNLEPYPYKDDSFLERYREIDKVTTEQLDNERLGIILQKVLKKIFIKKPEAAENIGPQSLIMLPRFNIFMNGHGEANINIAGINNNNLKRILEFLNYHIWIKSFGIMSCYLGGVRFKMILTHNYETLSSGVENLHYPILFIGSFFAQTYALLQTINSQTYEKDLVTHEFEDYFAALSTKVPDYNKALKVFATNSFYKFPLNNYGSIKFPYTNWIMANDYDKDVFNITNTKIVTAPENNLVIPRDKKIVLMSTNKLSSSITIEQIADIDNLRLPQFLPVHYSDQNYLLIDMRLPNVQTQQNINNSTITAKILQSLFNIFQFGGNTLEPINIAILFAEIGNIQVRNILCELHNESIYFEIHTHGTIEHYYAKINHSSVDLFIVYDYDALFLEKIYSIIRQVLPSTSEGLSKSSTEKLEAALRKGPSNRSALHQRSINGEPQEPRAKRITHNPYRMTVQAAQDKTMAPAQAVRQSSKNLRN